MDIISILTKYSVEAKDTKSLQLIAMIVNVICDILIKSNDPAILLRGTAFLKIYVPMCKDIIVSMYDFLCKISNSQGVFPKVINRFLDPSLLESNLVYIGNLTTHYFTHIIKNWDKQILEALAKRMYKCRMPSVVQSFILVFSRLLILHPEEIIQFLTGVFIEARPALKVLIDKWLLHQPLFRGKYFKNLRYVFIFNIQYNGLNKPIQG